MNFQTILVAAAAALVGSVSAQDVACNTTQSTAAFGTLAVLLTGTDLTDCSTASGYNMLYATSLPSAAENAKMCDAQSCHSLIATIIGLNPPNCILTIPTSQAKMNVYTLATTFEDGCKAVTTTPAPTTATPAATTATPAADSTPAATTTAPSASSTSGSAGSVTTTPVSAAC